MNAVVNSKGGIDIQWIIHICSGVLVFYPVYRDIREQKIWVLPAWILIFTGCFFNIFSGNILWHDTLLGIIPGIVCFGIGKMGSDCIGSGDCLLIMGVGLLEGLSFLMPCLVMTCGILVIYALPGLLLGKIQIRSKIPAAPFLALGYIGAWMV